MKEKCNQSGCRELASHRFTWPGRPPAGICAKHLGLLVATAEALGLRSVDLQPLTEPDADHLRAEATRAALVTFLLELVEQVRVMADPHKAVSKVATQLRRAGDELHARFKG